MRRDRRRCPRPSPRRAPSLRRAIVAIVAVFATTSAGLSTAACEGDAVGVDACKQIEQRRCELAPACAGKAGIPEIKDEVQIQNCKDIYRDHCLVGIENVAREPTKEQVDSCVAALEATTNCQKSGVAEMSGCAGVAVDDGSISPCKAFAAPEHLDACRFIESAATVAASTTATTSSSSSGTGGAGGA